MNHNRRTYLKGLASIGVAGLAGCAGGGGSGGDSGGSGGSGSGGETGGSGPPEEVRLTYGTSSEGSSSFQVGQVMSQVFSNKSDFVRIDPITTPGYFANIRLLSEGEIDVGMTWMRDGAQAYKGEGPFKEDPVKNPPIQAGPVHLVNAQTYYTYPDSDITTIDDLAGKVVAVGPSGAGATLIAEQLLKASDVYDQMDIRYMSYSDVRDAVRNKNVDAWAMINLNGLGWTSGHSEILQIVEAKLIEIPDSLFEEVANSSEFLFKNTISKSDWSEPSPNLPESFTALSSTASSAIVPPDADADVVYELVKTFSENLGTLRDQIGFFEPVGYGENKFGLEGLPASVPFHEGAVRYYEEKGIWSNYDLKAQGE